jgi:hypothetical protein
MARKARKATAAKKKTAKASERIKAKSTSETKPQSRTVGKVKPVRKRHEEAKVKSVTDKVVGSFQTLVDTIQETDALRKKIERPGSAET